MKKKSISVILFIAVLLFSFNAVAQINAVDDIGIPVNGPIGGLAVANVLSNDILNGNPANLSNVNLSVISSTSSNITLNLSDGSVNIAPGTPNGTYTIVYQICDKLNVTQCDTATITLTVTSIILVTLEDIYLDSSLPTGCSVGDMIVYYITVHNNGSLPLSNITITSYNYNISISGSLSSLAPGESNSTAFTGNYTITQADMNAGIVINSIVASATSSNGTESGSSTDPTPCNCPFYYNGQNLNWTGTLLPALIQATNDDFSTTPIVGSSGGTTASVLTNDTFNGVTVNISSLNLTPVSFPAGFTLNPDGTITIAAGVAPGTYSLTYQICEPLNPNNCSSATVSILVSNSLLPPTGNTSQSLIIGSTLADLVVYGQNILWYANNYAGKIQQYADTPLPSTTVLVNGATYFASQTVGGIESTSRLPVTVSLTALSTSNFAFSSFNFYPNPVKNSLTISNSSTIDEVEITSILGQKMIAKTVNDLQTELDLSPLSNGVYFVKVTSEGQEKTVKIVKE